MEDGQFQPGAESNDSHNLDEAVDDRRERRRTESREQRTEKGGLERC